MTSEPSLPRAVAFALGIIVLEPLFDLEVAGAHFFPENHFQLPQNKFDVTYVALTVLSHVRCTNFEFSRLTFCYRITSSIGILSPLAAVNVYINLNFD